MTDALRMLISGGGTGGHIYPALAVAEALQAMAIEAHTPLDLTFVGNADKNGKPALEATLAAERHLPFETLDFSGMPRSKNLVSWARWLRQLVRALNQARAILKQHRPHVVFTTGGYVTAPLLMAAKGQGIPFILHEPDARPGLVNRLMGRWAAEVTTAFDAAHGPLKNPRATTTGNPIRLAIGQMRKADALKALQLDWPDTQPVLLVMGGSQGAEKLNMAMLAALESVLNAGWAVIHQSGANKYEATRHLVPIPLQDHPRYRLWPYIVDVPAALAVADLALCRAGSLTLSELAAAGLPSVLVPYPFAAANHQWHNAQAFADAGASRVLADRDCTGESLCSTCLPLMQDHARRQAMSHAARQLGKPRAVTDIAQRLWTLACLTNKIRI